MEETMKWSSGLTGPHLEVAKFSGSYLRVKAGPGTGKTYALMRKVQRLIEEGEDPKSILAISYTRTAAKDLVEKLKELGVEGAENVVATTLHSLAFRLLARQEIFSFLNRIPRPLLQFEIDCLVHDLSLEFGSITRTRELLAEFESFWSSMITTEKRTSFTDEYTVFEKSLETWLQQHKCVLIGEFIVLALNYIRANPIAKEAIQYKHVLVDEYQDLNNADQLFIEALAADKITIIGDDDQSIYSFRKANPAGIRNFHLTHDGTHDIELMVCRRCPKSVLTLANSLIQHNRRGQNSFLKPFETNPEGTVFVVQHESDFHEAQNLADYINLYLTNNPEVNPGEILVLATRRQLGYEIRENLEKLNRRAQSFFIEELLDSLESQEGYTVLSLIENPDDQAALRSWLGLDKADKRSKAYKRIQDAADSQGISIKSFLTKAIDNPEILPKHCGGIFDRFLSLHSKLTICLNKSISEVIDICWPTSGNCKEIRELATTIASSIDNISTFKQELLIAITQPLIPSEKDGIIRIMSLHKSKGLTAKCVIVAGCNAGALPSLKVNFDTPELQLQSLEEQRRLFYVALTRTTDTLIVSSSASMPKIKALRAGIKVAKNSGGIAYLINSQFITEMSRDITVISGNKWKSIVGF